MHYSTLILLIAAAQVQGAPASTAAPAPQNVVIAPSTTTNSKASIRDNKNSTTVVGLTGNVAQNGDQQNMVSSSSNLAQNQTVIGVQSNSNSLTNNFVATNATTVNNATTKIDKIDNSTTNNLNSVATTVINNSYKQAPSTAPPSTNTVHYYYSADGTKKEVAPQDKKEQSPTQYVSSSLDGGAPSGGAAAPVDKMVALITEAKKMSDLAFEMATELLKGQKQGGTQVMAQEMMSRASVGTTANSEGTQVNLASAGSNIGTSSFGLLITGVVMHFMLL